MFELIFVLVFIATLLVTGLTMFTVFAAAGFALMVMVLLGMVGAVIKLIPWLIVIAVGIWFSKTTCIATVNPSRNLTLTAVQNVILSLQHLEPQ